MLQSVAQAKPYTSFAFFVPSVKNPGAFAKALRNLSPYGNIPYTHAPALDGSGHFFALAVDEFSYGDDVQRLGKEPGVSMSMMRRPWLDSEAALEKQMVTLAEQLSQRPKADSAKIWQSLKRLLGRSEHPQDESHVLH